MSPSAFPVSRSSGTLSGLRAFTGHSSRGRSWARAWVAVAFGLCLVAMGVGREAHATGQKIANPVAEFAGLDKITGRIISFDVMIDETVQFGALQVTPRVCYSRPATENPKTTAFIEVDEVTLDAQIRRIFTGWMFADSPGLNAVEHAVYDVWLTNCKASSNELNIGN